MLTILGLNPPPPKKRSAVADLLKTPIHYAAAVKKVNSMLWMSRILTENSVTLL